MQFEVIWAFYSEFGAVYDDTHIREWLESC